MTVGSTFCSCHTPLGMDPGILPAPTALPGFPRAVRTGAERVWRLAGDPFVHDIAIGCGCARNAESDAGQAGGTHSLRHAADAARVAAVSCRSAFITLLPPQHAAAHSDGVSEGLVSGLVPLQE